jgi:hypothetical protein
MQYLICQERKVSCNFSPPPLLFFLFKKCYMEMTSDARHDQTCVSSMMPIQKNSRSTCFFCLPQQVPTMLSQEKYGAKQNWFLDCIQNITSKSQAIKPDALGLGTKS